MIGNILLIAGIAIDRWLMVAALLCIVVSLVPQKFGHSLERHQAPPFGGSRDFLRRIYAEQFCNCWRFLLSGQWYGSLKARDAKP